MNGFFYDLKLWSTSSALWRCHSFKKKKQIFLLNMSLKESCSDSAELIQDCQPFGLTVSVGHINL